MLSCMKGVEIIFGKRAQPCTQSRLLAKASMLRRRIPAFHPKQRKLPQLSRWNWNRPKRTNS